MEYTITDAWQGRTVKEFLYGSVGVSRSVLIALKKREDGILLNGKHVTVRAVLRENDLLTLALDDKKDDRIEKILPVDLPVRIAYEDDFLLVANKPPHMPTHPTLGHYADTLANALAYRDLISGREGTVFRPVNRLDRDTSGLVLIARDQLCAAKLSHSLQNGRIEKTYLALLSGNVETDGGSIERPIRRVGDSIITRECCEEGQGDYALTHYRVICRMDGYTLVCASPITGRTHQLRVHFASIGHPILGDTLYGQASPLMARQALHACRLRFPHPQSGKMLDVFCLPPDDMLSLCKELNLNEISQLYPQ